MDMDEAARIVFLLTHGSSSHCYFYLIASVIP